MLCSKTVLWQFSFLNMINEFTYETTWSEYPMLKGETSIYLSCHHSMQQMWGGQKTRTRVLSPSYSFCRRERNEECLWLWPWLWWLLYYVFINDIHETGKNTILLIPVWSYPWAFATYSHSYLLFYSFANKKKKRLTLCIEAKMEVSLMAFFVSRLPNIDETYRRVEAVKHRQR